jgi:3,4-dihydroxy 2-butanone 4-phosphate synthase / GTP cyclohydrolase II
MQTIALACEALRHGEPIVITDDLGQDWTMGQGTDAPFGRMLDLLALAGVQVGVQKGGVGPAHLRFADIDTYKAKSQIELDLVAVADLPTIYSEHAFRAHSFVSRLDGAEQMALVGHGTGAVPLVRVHSECLTGDAFGSMRCDCGPQLQESLRLLAAGGILIYLRGHEGRGIGLANKMRAYALQDQGMDTAEANTALGLPEDARDYAQAAQMLRALGHSDIRLLSNNPDKATALAYHGINVLGVVPLIIAPNPFNRAYLDTKAQKFGHKLGGSGRI